MNKAIAALALLAVGATMSFATTISGSFIYVSGTTVATVTPKAAAQTVVLKVGSTNETFTDVIVTGSAANSIMAGTPFEILEKGSQPFVATFSSTNLIVGPTDLSGILGRRSVPMTTAGVLSDSVGFPVGEFDINLLSLYFPACTVGSFDFKNGILANFGSEVKSYSIAVPTSSSTATLGSAEYPLTQDPIESFSLLCSGNGGLSISGEGLSEAASTYQYLYISGVLTGSPTFFTSAVLSVTEPASAG